MIKQPFNSFAGGYYRIIQVYMKKAFKLLGISFDEGIILQNVHYNPGTTQDQIAENLILDAAAVARSLKVLEQKGLVSRVTDEKNQRRKLVTISPAGAELVNHMNSAMGAWDEAVFSDYDNAELIRVVNGMKSLYTKASSVDISSVLNSWADEKLSEL